MFQARSNSFNFHQIRSIAILLQIVLRVLAFGNDLIYDSSLYRASNKIADKISVYCLLKYSLLRK